MAEHVERDRKNEVNKYFTIVNIFVDYPSGAGRD
jgi:hypothetical protein